MTCRLVTIGIQRMERFFSFTSEIRWLGGNYLTEETGLNWA